MRERRGEGQHGPPPLCYNESMPTSHQQDPDVVALTCRCCGQVVTATVGLPTFMVFSSDLATVSVRVDLTEADTDFELNCPCGQPDLDDYMDAFVAAREALANVTRQAVLSVGIGAPADNTL